MVPSDVHAKFGSDLWRNEKVSGTPFFPGPGGSGLWAGGELPGERRLTGPFSSPCASEIFKLARSRRKSVGSRPWSQVPCMTNLVRTGRELKKFLGLCKIFPGRGKAGRRPNGRPASQPASQPAPVSPGRWLHRASENVAGKNFSVFNRHKPNLVCPLGVSVDDRPPTLKKIGQF